MGLIFRPNKARTIHTIKKLLSDISLLTASQQGYVAIITDLSDMEAEVSETDGSEYADVDLESLDMMDLTEILAVVRTDLHEVREHTAELRYIAESLVG